MKNERTNKIITALLATSLLTSFSTSAINENAQLSPKPNKPTKPMVNLMKAKDLQENSSLNKSDLIN